MLHELRPKKALGQNFLINPHILDKIISTAEINSNDIVIEIGPGTGVLTEKLVQKAGTVIAIEKDNRLIKPLKEKFRGQANVKIIEADILKFDFSSTPDTKHIPLATSYKIVANIPYYITSNFLRTVFEEWPPPKLIVLTIQKEVAQRIISKPPHMNLLALSVQYYSEPEIITYISKNNFRPVPKVDSAIIRLMPKAQGLKPEESEKLFKLIKTGFSEKRKQLASVLSKKLKLPKEKIQDAFQKEGIGSTARAENLSLEQWQKLAERL